MLLIDILFSSKSMAEVTSSGNTAYYLKFKLYLYFWKTKQNQKIKNPHEGWISNNQTNKKTEK